MSQPESILAPLQVLITASSQQRALVLVHALQASQFGVDYRHVETEEALRSALVSRPWDIVIHYEPTKNIAATHMLDILNEINRDLPCIIVADEFDPILSVGAMQMGADDFIPIEHLVLLAPATEREVHDAREHMRREAAEDELRQSEERFSKIFFTSPIGIAISVLDGGYVLDVNDACLEMFGYTRAEVIGRSFHELGILTSEQQYHDLIEHFEASTSLFNHETIFLNRDGRPRTVLLSVEVIELSGETCVLSMINDITDHKKAQEGYRLQAQMLDMVGQAVIASDLNGVVTYWNRAAEKMYGWSRREALGRPIVEVTPAPALKEHAAEIMENLSKGESWAGEFELQRRDGSVFPALVIDAPIHDERNTLIGIVGISMDITEQKHAEADRAIQSQIEAILESSSDAIVLIDRESRIVRANSSFSSLFAWSPDVSLSDVLMQVDKASPEYERFIYTLASVRDTGKLSSAEISILRRDGTAFYADVAMAPLSKDPDRRGFVICSLRDITRRKQIEEELRRSLKREKALGELKARFVSMVSHEFRTPLASIQTGTDLLKNYSDRMSPERREEHLDRIQAQVRHLAGLLEDVLTIGRDDSAGTPFHPNWINLDEVCRALVEDIQLSLAHPHEIHYSFGGQDPMVYADPKLLQRIVNNLLSNAIKYSPDRAPVRFEVKVDHDIASIEVRDRGIGIPEEDQPFLFSAFHRARNVGTVSGTGLGLAIVKRAIDAHGGSVSVNSEVGAGTTFLVTLPTKPHT